MSEITKLYENANIKQTRMCEWTCKDSIYCSPNCEHYESTQLHYPPFTAEKQIKLIKWLSEDDVVRIEKYTLGGETFYEFACTFNDWCDDYKYSYATEKFEESLAGLINDLWQSLTEEEKQQVKGILE